MKRRPLCPRTVEFESVSNFRDLGGRSVAVNQCTDIAI
jgi:hypothetical protein